MAEPARTSSRSLPVAPPGPGEAPRRPPTQLQCLHCQLTGRRRLLCSKADLCRELPQVFAVGPVLLGLWLATAAAFLAAIW